MTISDSDQNSGKGIAVKQEYSTDEIHAGHGLTATNVRAKTGITYVEY